MVEANFPRSTTNQKHYQNLDGDKSSVWNFSACFSDVILRGNPMVGSQKCRPFSQATLFTFMRLFPMVQEDESRQDLLGVWLGVVDRSIHLVLYKYLTIHKVSQALKGSS